MRKLLMLGLVTLTLASCDAGGSGGAVGAIPQAQPSPVVVQTAGLPRAQIGATYSEQLAGTTPPGTGPLAWELTQTSAPLPGGMTLSTGGLLSGLPVQSGLHELEVLARNTVGDTAVSSLDLVVYENLFYSYAPDQHDTPANDDYTSATQLGVLSMAGPLVEPGPLSVTSNPASPDVDWFAFSTPTRGDITVEVFFSNVVGKLITGVHGDHNGVLELKEPGVPGAGGDDNLIVLHDAPGGNWLLKVEAQYKNTTWYANAYALRIRFNDLTITTDLAEIDTGAGAPPVQLQGANAGLPVANGNWNMLSGALPAGLSLSPSGLVSGNPTQSGLFRVTVSVDVNGLSATREIGLRVFDSGAGNYWARFGEHRYYDAARVNGDGAYHEHYCEASVVAPHPDYGAEGAIYVIGGREVDTVANVYVFHTAHQANPDRNYKLQDINRPLTSERQYVGAGYLQHSYGGYIYVVGGELYSNTAPSSGDYTRVVERMQVADGAGVALATPGNWETLAGLPGDDNGRAIEGWAEFGLVAADAALDADDRLYLVAGRVRIESTPGSNLYQYEYNTRVVMYEAPVSGSAPGAWYVKSDASPYSPRRMPMVGMVSGRIYIIGGRTPTGTADYVEMYEPDPTGANAALSQAGSAGFPTLAEPVWYGACTVRNGALYLLNGWKLQGFSPVATARLQRLTPNSGGTGGAMDQLATPDNGSGYHSAVFHDGKLWFITGRDSFVPTPRYSLCYEP